MPKSHDDEFDKIMEEYIDSKVSIVATNEPHSVRFINPQNPEQRFAWVSSCSHENLISAVGEHGAFMIGYAKDPTKTVQNT